MEFIIFLVIALAWAGWAVSWNRDRRSTGDAWSGMGRGVRMPAPSSRWSAPRSGAMARRRRREVLGGLIALATLTFLLAQAWSAMWAIHLLVDLALVGYAFAVLSIERPDALESLRSSLRPVVVEEPSVAEPVLDLDELDLELDAEFELLSANDRTIYS